MISIRIDTTSNDARRRLGELSDGLKSRAVRIAIGGTGVAFIRAHFERLNSERANKLGGKRTDFYSAAANGTRANVTEDGVNIEITKTGIAQRLYGGRIVPTKGNWLTIPARKEAYGRRAGEFDNLRFVFYRPNLAALVERESMGISFGKTKKGLRIRRNENDEKRDAGGGVMFWLKNFVDQDPDPSVLPPESEILDAALAGGIDHINAMANLQ